MNDSLLYVGAPVDTDTLIRVNRFAEDNALLVVNAATDGVSIIRLPDRGKILLHLKGGAVSADIK